MEESGPKFSLGSRTPDIVKCTVVFLDGLQVLKYSGIQGKKKKRNSHNFKALARGHLLPLNVGYKVPTDLVKRLLQPKAKFGSRIMDT